MRKKLLWMFLIAQFIFSTTLFNMIQVITAQETHDIAVTSIALTRVMGGEFVNVTIVARNNGMVNESFNITLFYDDTPIETQNVTDLASDTDTMLLFIWNTTNIMKGSYSVEAVASTVEGETNIANNSLTSPINVETKSTYIAVIPQSTVDTTLTVGKNFTVSIYTDYNGSDVWSYEFTLTYNPLILQGVKVSNGDLINKDKDPSADFLPGTFDNTLGKLSLTGAYFNFIDPPAPLTSGPGVLANVTFQVVGEGDCSITLGTETASPSKLEGYTEDGFGDEYIIIDDSTPGMDHILHGYFRNTAEPVIHDIAVLSVTPSNTSMVAGDPLNITVVVENQGTIVETFDVEVYYDYDPNFPSFNRIGKETVIDLAPDVSKTLVFVWDTTEVLAANHTLTGVVSELDGETDIEDNTRESDQVVTILELKEPPLPILEIVGVAAVIVVAIALAYYALKRRKKAAPE